MTSQIPLGLASEIGVEVIEMLRPLCHKIQVAGSIRRQKPFVKDGEIVALPLDAPALNARLDRLVMENVIRQAHYGSTGTRWGKKYRGFYYRDIRFELFHADWNNWGYILWLRTGPGEANAHAMSQMQYHKSPYNPKDGYLWFKKRKLRVADEAEMFRLLGMQELPPRQRTLEAYQRLMASPHWAEEWVYAPVHDEAGEQRSLL